MDDAGLREIFPYEEIWDLFFHTGEAMFFCGCVTEVLFWVYGYCYFSSLFVFVY